MDATLTQERWLTRHPFGRKVQLRRHYDPDAQAYFSRLETAGRTLSVEAKTDISTFVIELKRLGLWESLIDGWLMRSEHNAGSGSTVFALKTADASLVNGPTWGVSGITVTGFSARVQAPGVSLPASPCACVVVGSLDWDTAFYNSVLFGHADTVHGRCFGILTAWGVKDRNWCSIGNGYQIINYHGSDTMVPVGGFHVLQFSHTASTTALSRVDDTGYTTFNNVGAAIGWDTELGTGPFCVVKPGCTQGKFTTAAALFFRADTSGNMAEIEALVRATIGRVLHDADAEGYFSRVAAAGTVLGDAEKANISAFITGLKAMGAWAGLVDAWLLRSTQNVGTGSVVIGLKSMNGTLVNGPTWGADGMRSNGVASEVFVDANLNAGSFGAFTLFTCHAGLTGAAHGGFSSDDIYTPWWSLSHNWYGQNQSGFGVLNTSAGWVSAAVTNPPAYNHAGFQTNQFNLGAAFTARHQGLLGQWPVQGGNMAAAFNATPNMDLHLGNYQGSGFKYAFVALFRTEAPDLHTLYRDTIGRGLGLP